MTEDRHHVPLVPLTKNKDSSHSVCRLSHLETKLFWRVPMPRERKLSSAALPRPGPHDLPVQFATHSKWTLKIKLTVEGQVKKCQLFVAFVAPIQPLTKVQIKPPRPTPPAQAQAHPTAWAGSVLTKLRIQMTQSNSPVTLVEAICKSNKQVKIFFEECTLCTFPKECEIYFHLTKKMSLY